MQLAVRSYTRTAERLDESSGAAYLLRALHTKPNMSIVIANHNEGLQEQQSQVKT